MKIVFNRIENIKEKSNNIFIHMFKMVFYSIDLYNSEVTKKRRCNKPFDFHQEMFECHVINITPKPCFFIDIGVQVHSMAYYKTHMFFLISIHSLFSSVIDFK